MTLIRKKWVEWDDEKERVFCHPCRMVAALTKKLRMHSQVMGFATGRMELDASGSKSSPWLIGKV